VPGRRLSERIDLNDLANVRHANQLLAAVALCVATTVIINIGKARYCWVTIAPLSFVATTTLVAGYESIRDIFWPQAQNPGRPRRLHQYFTDSADHDGR